MIIDRTGRKAEASASEKYLASERGDRGSKLTPHTVNWPHYHKMLNFVQDTEELAETWLRRYEAAVQCALSYSKVLLPRMIIADPDFPRGVLIVRPMMQYAIR